MGLKKVLAGAVDDGLISAEQGRQLESYLSARGISSGAGEELGSEATVLDAPLDPADTEAPRFVRGFHDILITIGVVIALVGLWGIGSVFAVLPAIVVLSEILVRRQRLALPAFALTIALAHGALMIGLLFIGNYDGVSDWQPLDRAAMILLLLPPLLGLFYWRYRVPVALSLLVLSVFVLALVLVFLLLGKTVESANFILDYRLLSASIFLVAALSLFAVAMRYDLSDPQRRTRRSDVAFWLHLGAAPALLYAMLSFVFLDRLAGNWWSGDAAYGRAAAVIAVVALFMLVGLVIDRRAFVTSGLLSLGLAIWTLVSRSQTVPTSYAFATILTVGVVVLLVGIFWQALRRKVVQQLPAGIARRLHAVH
ncbi:MAG: hypothetical protein QHC90_13905 [Shinella sp.]|nr:hypothetical protein [Shinella sp.]